jgi:uncharacterized protein (DUF1800 family)
MTPSVALVMLHRFGLGPRPGDLAHVSADPRSFLEAELNSKTAALIRDDALLSAADSIVTFRDAMAKDHAAKIKARSTGAKGSAAASMTAAPMPSMMNGVTPGGNVPPGFHPRDQIVATETRARLKAALAHRVGFVERLVWFWSNHFAVSINKSFTVRASAGAMEREAIRPHILGRFSDMLLAVELHPAMLVYLDNVRSIGPNSPAGKNRRRGLNENLAREILELHTLGVAGGYTQTDVTNLARILTGWGIVGMRSRRDGRGSTVFNAGLHEPGAFPLLGKTYPEGGEEQARAALTDLARHPSTARFLATKLVKHFVADKPPPALVDKLAKVYQDTEGDLAAVSLALIQAPEAWSNDTRKFRSPQEFLVAALRLFNETDGGANFATTRSYLIWLRLMGQPLWAPAGPNGFPDTAADWGSPESIKLRLQIAVRFAERANGDARKLLDAAFGQDVSSDTRATITRAASRSQAISLLLMAPEFQWR